MSGNGLLFLFVFLVALGAIEYQDVKQTQAKAAARYEAMRMAEIRESFRRSFGKNFGSSHE